MALILLSLFELRKGALDGEMPCVDLCPRLEPVVFDGRLVRRSFVPAASPLLDYPSSKSQDLVPWPSELYVAQQVRELHSDA